MNFRVNLLQQEDVARESQRRPVAAVIGVVLVVGVIGLIGSKLVRGIATRAQYRSAQARWEKLEPRFNAAQDMRDRVLLCNAIQAEMEGWKQARVDLHPILEGLYTCVPATVQLTRMNLRSSYAVERLPPRKAAEKKAPPQKVMRKYEISLEGVAVGDRSDQVVVDFVEQLKISALDSDLFPSVKLQRLQQEDATEEESEELPTSSFSIKIISIPRVL